MKSIPELMEDDLWWRFEDHSIDIDWNFRNFFNKKTGEIIHICQTSYYFNEEWKDFRENRENYIEIPRYDVKIVYEDMKKYCKKVEDENVKFILQSALDWSLPLNTFEFVINEFYLEWSDFKERQRGKRFVEWLKKVN